MDFVIFDAYRITRPSLFLAALNGLDQRSPLRKKLLCLRQCRNQTNLRKVKPLTAN